MATLSSISGRAAFDINRSEIGECVGSLGPAACRARGFQAMLKIGARAGQIAFQPQDLAAIVQQVRVEVCWARTAACSIMARAADRSPSLRSRSP